MSRSKKETGPDEGLPGRGRKDWVMGFLGLTVLGFVVAIGGWIGLKENEMVTWVGLGLTGVGILGMLISAK